MDLSARRFRPSLDALEMKTLLSAGQLAHPTAVHHHHRGRKPADGYYYFAKTNNNTPVNNLTGSRLRPTRRSAVSAPMIDHRCRFKRRQELAPVLGQEPSRTALGTGIPLALAVCLSFPTRSASRPRIAA